MANSQVRTALMVIALVAVGCGGSSAGTAASDDTAATTAAAPAASTTEAPPPASPTTTTTEPPPPPDLELIERGPYDVGVKTITFTDTDRDRTLTADVWFPLADGIDGPSHQYTFIPTIFYESPAAISAEPESISAEGPFPLIVYSHGHGGIRFISSDFTEFIASHGYVVAGVDHPGNTALDIVVGAAAEFEDVAFNRPNDVTALIDEMLDPSDAEVTDFSASIDAGNVAITGHSFGGFTAYASIVGLDTDDGIYEPDERVDAILTLAPLTVPELLSDEQLGSIDVPSMIIVGTDDKTTPIDPNVDRPWDLGSSRPAYRVELLAAEHQSFSDVCAYQDAIETNDAIPQQFADFVDDYAQAGCQPDDMPIGRAQALTNTFAITFLDEVFRGGEPIDATAAVIPDDVSYAVR